MGLIYSFMFLTSASLDYVTARASVEIVKAEQVGIYDVQVVQSRDAAALIEWLNQHQFYFDEEDIQVFEEYLRRGWYFVVARVNPTAEQLRVPEALVAPLILRFQAEAPVYPLALTATAGQRTEVLLYLLGEHKWEGDGRLDLYSAGGTPSEFSGWAERLNSQLDIEAVDPLGFFVDAETDLPYLCRYKGTLSAREMQEDLTFVPAGDDEPYRRWMLRW